MNKPSSPKNSTETSAKRRAIKPVYAIVAGIIIIAFLALFILPNFFKSTPVDEEHVFKKEGELTITDSTGNVKQKLDIEIADNDYDRELGLMFRKEMKENRGMLFIFPIEEMQSFWMKNTVMPLDIIFINAKKEIVTIQKDAVPFSETSLPSSKPSQYVLEVNGGYTQRYNIKEGDKVSF